MPYLKLFLLSLLPFIIIFEALADGSICMYTTSEGRFVQVNSLTDVPEEYLANARCIAEKKHVPPKKTSLKTSRSVDKEKSPYIQTLQQLFNRERQKDKRFSAKAARSGEHLARPDEIDLDGNIRRETISSPLGPIHLRWPRSVESFFGRTPLRAMADAARTVRRATRTAAFPTKVQNLSIEWQVVFLDENLPAAQIPSSLRRNCHPGWMTPPGNIYIVAERVAGGCGGQSRRPTIADSDLAEVLVHELGHAVEFYILGGYRHPNRMRAEGFATWFEMYAASYSSMLSRSTITKRTKNYALMSFKHSPDSFTFLGDAASYARASMYFLAISEKRGVRGVMEVYEKMTDDNLPFFPAVRKALYWDKERLEKEARRVASK